jgi:hypothetical protein
MTFSANKLTWPDSQAFCMAYGADYLPPRPGLAPGTGGFAGQ